MAASSLSDVQSAARSGNTSRYYSEWASFNGKTTPLSASDKSLADTQMSGFAAGGSGGGRNNGGGGVTGTIGNPIDVLKK